MAHTRALRAGAGAVRVLAHTAAEARNCRRRRAAHAPNLAALAEAAIAEAAAARAAAAHAAAAARVAAATVAAWAAARAALTAC